MSWYQSGTTCNYKMLVTLSTALSRVSTQVSYKAILKWCFHQWNTELSTWFLELPVRFMNLMNSFLSVFLTVIRSIEPSAMCVYLLRPRGAMSQGEQVAYNDTLKNSPFIAASLLSAKANSTRKKQTFWVMCNSKLRTYTNECFVTLAVRLRNGLSMNETSLMTSSYPYFDHSYITLLQ